MTEAKLYNAVKNGNITAAMFVLKTIGRNRGYVERQEITGADNNEIVFKVIRE